MATTNILKHEFDSSQTCDYCGIAAERTKLGDVCPKRREPPPFNLMARPFSLRASHFPAPPLSGLAKKLAEVYEVCEQLEKDSDQLGQVRATLAVNCRTGRALAGRGCTYDETKSVLANLVTILEQLTKAEP